MTKITTYDSSSLNLQVLSSLSVWGANMRTLVRFIAHDFVID